MLFLQDSRLPPWLISVKRYIYFLVVGEMGAAFDTNHSLALASSISESFDFFIFLLLFPICRFQPQVKGKRKITHRFINFNSCSLFFPPVPYKRGFLLAKFPSTRFTNDTRFFSLLLSFAKFTVISQHVIIYSHLSGSRGNEI